MSNVRARVFTYTGTLDTDGALRAEDGPPLRPDDSWTPEHLLLAAMVRCVLTSLRYYARDREVTASAKMSSTITMREEDGLYAQVDAELSLDVTIDPPLEPAELPRLLGRAEHGCFVGNSLRAKPRYRWRVNGAEVT